MVPCIALAFPAFVAGMLSQAKTTALRSEPAPASFYWGDFDRDGLDDVFVVTPAATGHLLKNRGDGTLSDVTASLGLRALVQPRFAAWQDFDRDEDLDLFVGSATGPSLLFANQGSAGFADVTETVGLAQSSPALHAEFLDYDRDGWLDLHLRTTEEDRLYRNLGGRLFARVELDLGGDLASPANAADLRMEDSAALPEPSTARASPPAGPSRTASPESPESGGGPGPRVGRAPMPPPGSAAPPLLAPDPGEEEVLVVHPCAGTIDDQDAGACLAAGSIPTLGELYPITSNLFVDALSGFVGLNDTTPSTRLDVDSTLGAAVSAVRGDGNFGPTRGYLAAQGTTDFDGLASADWSGQELGVVGIAAGAGPTDNFGVVGHSSGVGVRGEYSVDPAGTFGELGTLNGVGVRADGSTLAGEFLGDVDVRGHLDLENGGLLEMFDNTGANEKVDLNPDNVGGASLTMFNEAGADSVFVDSDWALGAMPAS